MATVHGRIPVDRVHKWKFLVITLLSVCNLYSINNHIFWDFFWTMTKRPQTHPSTNDSKLGILGKAIISLKFLIDRLPSYVLFILSQDYGHKATDASKHKKLETRNFGLGYHHSLSVRI
jgi:hypothetical protein